MTSTITRFESAPAPCGRLKNGTRSATEDEVGLFTEEIVFTCGCRRTREEFHDGSVHRLIVHHSGKVLLEEELRGE